MTPQRIFLVVNIVLGAAGCFFIYYLATAKYAPPAELEKADQVLEMVRVRYTPTDEGGERPPVIPEEIVKNLTNLSRNPMGPRFAMSPTPPPTPKPTATPVPLQMVISTWALAGMDEKSATITDSKTGEDFELTLGGQGKSIEFQGQTTVVTLCGVDLEADPPTAKFCSSDGRSVVLSLQ